MQGLKQIIDVNKPIFTNMIKKGMKIKSMQLGVACTGIMADNMKGNTRMVEVKGTEVGMFDETGSVYAHDIVMVLVDDVWRGVSHTEAQQNLKNTVDKLFG